MCTKRFLLGIAVLTLLGGCPVDPEPGRLEVNDGLRAACWYMTDPEIDAVIALAEVDRTNGYSYVETLEAASWSCWEFNPWPVDCEVCLYAVIRQVYLGL